MSGQFYDNALRETYRVKAATISAAAVIDRFIGPAGKRGRVVNVAHVVTTDVTVAASNITVGNNGATNPVTHVVPVSTANSGAAIPAASLKGQVEGSDGLAAGEIAELAADTVVEVASDGGSTAGAVDLLVTVDWF